MSPVWASIYAFPDPIALADVKERKVIRQIERKEIAVVDARFAGFMQSRYCFHITFIS